jgi:hypothetical protein
MIHRSLFFPVFAVFILTAHAQQPNTSLQIDPDQGRLNFQPLIASHLEPRLGLTRLIGERRLRLDIGNSVDLLAMHFHPGSDELLSIGADFFTWSSLRQTANFHFPVDAADYLFGINSAYQKKISDAYKTAFRFRWSHISAHLVDGSTVQNEASGGSSKYIYSREYFEIIGAVTYRDFLRVYAGGQYIYHVDPSIFGKINLQWGAEATAASYPTAFMNPYVAYDCRLIETNVFTTAHSLQAGIKFGSPRGSNVDIYLAFYSGISQQGIFTAIGGDWMKWSYWGPGFSIGF